MQNQEPAMLHDMTTRIRLLVAFAAGALIDLFALRGAFPYGDRNWLGGHAIVIPFWFMLALLFFWTFVLDLEVRRLPRENDRPRRPVSLAATLDSYGLLTPFAIALGLTAAHTTVLVRDMLVDPTTHNLLPFEYLVSWVVIGIPAVIGSLLARAVSWVNDRIREQ
jgi:hypothetical protein